AWGGVRAAGGGPAGAPGRGHSPAATPRDDFLTSCVPGLAHARGQAPTPARAGGGARSQKGGGRSNKLLSALVFRRRTSCRLFDLLPAAPGFLRAQEAFLCTAGRQEGAGSRYILLGRPAV